MLAFHPLQYHTPITITDPIAAALDPLSLLSFWEQLENAFDVELLDGYIRRRYGLIWRPPSPAIAPLARAVASELIYIYPSSIFCIVQDEEFPNNPFVVGRIK